MFDLGRAGGRKQGVAAPASILQGRQKQASQLQHQLVVQSGRQQRGGLPVPAQPDGQTRW